MSQKNKPHCKIYRRLLRGKKGCHPRTPVSQPVPAAIATKILTSPKYKVNARIRRKLAARRDVILEIPRQEPKHPAVKLTLQLQRLSLATLYRRLKQSARRAATCRNILAELSKDSQFAPPIIAQQTYQLGVYKQVAAEIKSRNV